MADVIKIASTWVRLHIIALVTLDIHLLALVAQR